MCARAAPPTEYDNSDHNHEVNAHFDALFARLSPTARPPDAAAAERAQVDALYEGSMAAPESEIYSDDFARSPGPTTSR